MHLLSSFERLYLNGKETSLANAVLMSAFMMLVYLAAIEENKDTHQLYPLLPESWKMSGFTPSLRD